MVEEDWLDEADWLDVADWLDEANLLDGVDTIERNTLKVVRKCVELSVGSTNLLSSRMGL